MTTLNADETLLSYLSPLKEETVIRDAAGKRIGRFVPGDMTDEEVYARAHEFLDIGEAKRRKVAERGNGSPLAEVRKRLGIEEIDR